MSCQQPWRIIYEVLAGPTDACASFSGAASYAFSLGLPSYAMYFGFTFALEFPFYWLASGRRLKAALIVCLVGNLATHPLICFVLVNWASRAGVSYGRFVVGAEAFAFATEMVIASLVFRSRVTAAFAPAVWVFLGNAVSWTVGTFL